MRCRAKLGGIKFAHHPGGRSVSVSATMTQEFSVSASGHGPGIAQERLYGVAGRGRLPFIAIERPDLEHDLRDLLLGSTSPVSVEGPQHPSQACPLLAGQARIRWDDAVVQGREEAPNGFDPVEALEAERNDGDRERVAVDGAVENLEILPVAEIETKIRIRALHPKPDVPGRDRYDAQAFAQTRRGIGQNDDAGIMLRQPEDRSLRRCGQRIDGEIAIPTAAGCARSAVRDLPGQQPRLQNPRHRLHCGGAIPMPDRMLSTHRDAHTPPWNAR